MAMWIVPGILGLIGLVMFLRGFGAIGRGKAMSGGVGALSGGVLMAAGVAVGLVGLNLRTYQALTYEQQVAEVHLTQVGPQNFNARIVRPNEPEKTVQVLGDEFRIEARVLKFQPWANVLGFNAMYRLDRVSGRYIDATAERSAPRTVEPFFEPGKEPGLDVYTLSSKYGQNIPLVDALYGSGAYVPMADKAVYTISMSQTGLVARAANDVARQAVGGWPSPQTLVSPEGTEAAPAAGATTTPTAAPAAPSPAPTPKPATAPNP
jgi:hypothetical protein